MLQIEEGPIRATDDRGEGRVQHGTRVPSGAVCHIVLVEKLHYVVVHPVLGHISGQAVHVVCDVPIGKMVQQDFCCFETAFPSSKEEWCLFLKTQRISILAALLWGDWLTANTPLMVWQHLEALFNAVLHCLQERPTLTGAHWKRWITGDDFIHGSGAHRLNYPTRGVLLCHGSLEVLWKHLVPFSHCPLWEKGIKD